jgi:hypothetical protein
MDSDSSQSIEPPQRPAIKSYRPHNYLTISENMMARCSSDGLQGAESVILACPESFYIKKGFPTSGNDIGSTDELPKTATPYRENIYAKLSIRIDCHVA